jgi:hypothetical protein
MIKLRTNKLPAVLSLAVLSVAYLVSFGFFNEANAICTNACQTGMHACLDWCNAHNKTNRSQAICSFKCADYWLSGKNPQSIGRSDPVNPTDGITPPRLKNPPTTVSDPTPPSRRPVGPVQPVKPVGVSNPNKTDGGSVILLREHNDSGGQGHRH